MLYFLVALNAGLVGLGLTYTLSLAGMFQYCVRLSAAVENVVSNKLKLPAGTNAQHRVYSMSMGEH